MYRIYDVVAVGTDEYSSIPFKWAHMVPDRQITVGNILAHLPNRNFISIAITETLLH